MTEPGKELERAKRSRTRLRKALKNCCDLNNIVGVAESAVQSPVAEILVAIDSFIDEDVLVGDVVDGVFEDELVEGVDGIDPGESVESSNAVVQEKIDEIKERLRDVEVDVANRERIFNNFKTAIKRADNMLTKTNEAIKASKGARRQSGDGIESQLFGWMKVLFRIHQPAYHGGKLIGKDCMKIMAHAHEMFTRFALILKRNKKTDCKYSGEMIDEICADFALLSVLWDGALSLAGKVNPSADDIERYNRFVRAAFFTHQAMGMSITHKVHLMWVHIAIVVVVPGGLGKKREDWIEKGHQYGSELR